MSEQESNFLKRNYFFSSLLKETYLFKWFSRLARNLVRNLAVNIVKKKQIYIFIKFFFFQFFGYCERHAFNKEVRTYQTLITLN